MYIQKGDLLNIHQSASKPSLLSSYWSIHVQVQVCFFKREAHEHCDLEMRWTAR
ncbi:unnamed protein product [Heligmosomoides polygyrus]|uniref:Uncharacterized protein n=1 Tax=Heligmosomoides polygyrus TaxID=6339 RepID=A0A183G5N8_HELPZ|nr:unnamed protein product [Heligmosomoides polygyrus]